ncbi:MAG TPA: zinc-ribbon domain-containing protein [Acidobacteriota bacterium]|jgi:hypothetical protein|nr:zinc-ribbon domain-containing protein [Acidobacteriota bacterium]HQP73749.1 zinc-ribbon domain-containing protein [Acidobacteriota bacterium]
MPRPTLADARPDLAAQWHESKNGSLRPSDVTCGIPKKVWWRCPQGHEWVAQIVNRVYGQGCPFCAGYKTAPENSLQARNPDLAAQWHPTQNGALTPIEIMPYSSRKVWWRCPRGHEWRAVVAARSRGHGCPVCEHRRPSPEYNLAVCFPEVAREWFTELNLPLTPDDVLPSVPQKVWWRCDNGHAWRTTINSRTSTRRTGCPFCAGKRTAYFDSLEVHFPLVAAEWHPKLNGRLKPSQFSPKSIRLFYWRCPAGHVYRCTIRNKVKGAECPICFPEMF